MRRLVPGASSVGPGHPLGSLGLDFCPFYLRDSTKRLTVLSGEKSVLMGRVAHTLGGTALQTGPRGSVLKEGT